MVQDGLPANGATINNPTTTTSRIMEVLRRHRTALQCRTNNIREIHIIGMMDILDNKAASSFNPQRTLIMVSAVASRFTRHHRAHRQTYMEMESSDDLEATGGYEGAKGLN